MMEPAVAYYMAAVALAHGVLFLAHLIQERRIRRLEKEVKRLPLAS